MQVLLIVFQVCFVVGLGYSVISFLLGNVLGIFGSGADAGAGVDLDIDNIAAASESSSYTGTSPFKPTSIAAFLVVFGGAGWIILPRFGIYFALMLSAALGLAAGFLMYRFVYLPLYNAQNTTTVSKQSHIGTFARATETIPQGMYGKITYYVKGGTYTAPAKSEDGNEIARGVGVEIVNIDRSTYYVRKKEY